tara:strand:+ start:18301 stop:19212 length:912 start_codon:yes stop_codon:yes gene_type:complete
MFPDNFNYHGVDISSSRLSLAVKNSNSEDRFYRADLVKPLGITNYFDVIVSCNTLSHIPVSSRLSVLANLCSTLTSGGDLFVNVGLDSHLRHISQFLSSSFNSVEPIYFDSFLSHDAESRKLVNYKNVHESVVKNESSLPNDACLHSQVLFHAKSFLKSTNDVIPPPDSVSSSSIPILNNVSDLSLLTFPTDVSLYSEILKSRSFSLVVVSDLLFKSKEFSSMSDLLSSSGISFVPLSQLELVPSSISLIYLVGFEQQYVSDLAGVRLSVNRIREFPQLSLRYCFVRSRGDSMLSASLLFSDI